MDGIGHEWKGVVKVNPILRALGDENDHHGPIDHFHHPLGAHPPSTLPETNNSSLKIGGWEKIIEDPFLFGIRRIIMVFAVSFIGSLSHPFLRVPS